MLRQQCERKQIRAKFKGTQIWCSRVSLQIEFERAKPIHLVVIGSTRRERIAYAVFVRNNLDVAIICERKAWFQVFLWRAGRVGGVTRQTQQKDAEKVWWF